MTPRAGSRVSNVLVVQVGLGVKPIPKKQPGKDFHFDCCLRRPNEVIVSVHRIFIHDDVVGVIGGEGETMQERLTFFVLAHYVIITFIKQRTCTCRIHYVIRLIVSCSVVWLQLLALNISFVGHC